MWIGGAEISIGFDLRIHPKPGTDRWEGESSYQHSISIPLCQPSHHSSVPFLPTHITLHYITSHHIPKPAIVRWSSLTISICKIRYI